MLAIGVPGVASAQDSQPSAPTVEEIVVTAQRREERLQDVPIAVSAVTGRSLERAGVTDTRQLTQMTPSLVFSRANTSFQPYIRGVGTRNANIGDESNVSVYIDGVYQPVMSGLGFDLINVERIEVLRGPQGTLFGRNSTGGLINIITPDPSEQPSGRILLRAGNFGERSAQGYVTGGLAPGLALDLAVGAYRDSGYIKDLAHGGHVGDRVSNTARLKLLFEPTSRFRAVLTGSYADFDDASSVNGQPLDLNTSARARPPVPAVIPTKPWQSALETVNQSGSLTRSLDLQTRLRFNGFNLETTSSLIDSGALSQTDNDATTAPLARTLVTLESKYWSNEVRLLSTRAGPISWIGGAYFFGGDGRFNPLQTVANNVLGSSTFTEQSVFSWATFGEATFELGEHWRLVTGLRYTEETRKYDARTASAILVPQQHAKFSKLTDRLSLQYRFSRDANVYFSYSRGFKSGVFNGFATTVAAAAPTRPETLDSYELGLKADPLPWLRTNVSVFHYDYRDIQQSARSPTSSLVVLFNAASAKLNGGEVEITARASENLNLRFYATYLDAKYESFPTAQIFTPLPAGGNAAVAPFDASGKDMIRAPKFTFGLNFDYTRTTEIGDFGLSGNIFYSDKYYWDFQNRVHQPAYTMVNGEVSWSPSGRTDWRFSIWGRNLANEVVYAQMLESTFGDIVGFERPRSYGVSLSKRF